MTQREESDSKRRPVKRVGPLDLTNDQGKRARDLSQAGIKRHDAAALVHWWDRVPLERRLAMFEAAGNEEEAAIVRAALESERAR